MPFSFLHLAIRSGVLPTRIAEWAGHESNPEELCLNMETTLTKGYRLGDAGSGSRASRLLVVTPSFPYSVLKDIVHVQRREMGK